MAIIIMPIDHVNQYVNPCVIQYYQRQSIHVNSCAVLVICVAVAAAQWELLKSTATAGAAVVGIMNPASGPGTTTDPSYITAIDDVKSSGAQVHTMHAMVAGLPRLGHFC